MRWSRGASTVDGALADDRLERIRGGAADGSALLRSARALLASAQRELDQNPEAAYVLAYDAARKPSPHYSLNKDCARGQRAPRHVEHVVRAQFGGAFDEFGMLRRRRAEIEYPQHPGDDVDTAEAAEAFAAATRITDAADQIVPELSLYT